VRPNFMILVYAFTRVGDATKTEREWCKVLLGPHPTAAQVQRFSNELQVTSTTPPTLLLAAEDDSLADVGHSIRFYEALRNRGVPAELVLFERGQHGFLGLMRDDWMDPMWAWLGRNEWVKR
jgi:dipeptidyl aminopeptidase/acylaminoacyl peptidase